MRERHKRDIALKIDPETKEKYWSNEVVTVYKPDEEDRVNAVLDILKGVMTAEEVRKKFDIATVNSVYTWIGKYVTQEKALSLEEQSDEDMARKSKDDQIRELQAQLKQARKEAELEKLRAKSGIWTGHSLRAVWLQQAILLQMGQSGVRRQRHRAAHCGESERIPQGQSRFGMCEVIPDSETVV